MRTTIRLNEALLRQVKRKALAQHKTFTAVVEDALAAWVQGGPIESNRNRKVSFPKSGKGGLLPGVDLESNKSLVDTMDGLS
jgi:ribbon-helix-helix CopG family protein